MCPFSCVTRPLSSSPSAFLCSEKQQKTLPSWMGLSLQLTKVLMNRGIVRERFVLTAHVCDPDVPHMCCLCPCHSFQEEMSGWCGSYYFYVLFLATCGAMCLDVCFYIRCRVVPMPSPSIFRFLGFKHKTKLQWSIAIYWLWTHFL